MKDIFNKILDALKSSQFWAGFACGAVTAVAVPSVAKIVTPVAKAIPGSKA